MNNYVSRLSTFRNRRMNQSERTSTLIATLFVCSLRFLIFTIQRRSVEIRTHQFNKRHHLLISRGIQMLPMHFQPQIDGWQGTICDLLHGQSLQATLCRSSFRLPAASASNRCTPPYADSNAWFISRMHCMPLDFCNLQFFAGCDE